MMHEQIDWNAVAAIARGKTGEEIRHAISDAHVAANLAWQIEQSGNPVGKSQGFYHDEISIYNTELARRKKQRCCPECGQTIARSKI
tara:strand:- start:25 stop:285 length:261 start_codon:yes stop_codon:yes gene_type:complete